MHIKVHSLCSNMVEDINHKLIKYLVDIVCTNFDVNKEIQALV